MVAITAPLHFAAVAVLVAVFCLEAQPSNCDAAPAMVADTTAPIAQLGTTRLTAKEFAELARSLDSSSRQQALADTRVMNEFIQLQIVRKALLNEARMKSWDQRPEIARQIDEAHNAIVLKTYLASVAMIPDGYPSERDIAASYDLNRDSFLVPRQYHLQQIFIALPSDAKATAAAEQKAEAISHQAHTPGADFAALARVKSEHKASAAKGGDLGWAIETQIVPEVRSRIAGLSIGEVSEPIRSAVGWHIVRLIDTKPAAPRPLQDVRASLVAMLRGRKLRDLEQAYIVNLLKKTPPILDEARARKILEAAK